MQIANDNQTGSIDLASLVPYRRRTMGVMIPDVARPILLTDRLRGVCGCGSCGCGSGLTGPPLTLGQVDPGSLTLEINTMIASARAFWNSLVNALGIHAGAKEANVITPMQDKITHDILAPAAQMRADVASHSCDDFRKMLGVINQSAVEFKAFLTNTTWKDGRAAQQALVWLEGGLPASTTGAWFHQVQADFQATTNIKCAGVPGGGTPIPPGGQVTGPSSVLPLVLGAAFFLLNR